MGTGMVDERNRFEWVRVKGGTGIVRKELLNEGRGMGG
jgi:hypothetical protein